MSTYKYVLSVAMAGILCGSTFRSTAESGVDRVRLDVMMVQAVAATNPVIEVTWVNVGTNVVTWRNATTNRAATWLYSFLDLASDGRVCELRNPEVEQLGINIAGVMDIPVGGSVRFRMEVVRRWVLPEKWQQLMFRFNWNHPALTPFGRDGYCEIVNGDEVFTFDREGNRVQNTDPDP